MKPVASPIPENKGFLGAGLKIRPVVTALLIVLEGVAGAVLSGGTGPLVVTVDAKPVAPRFVSAGLESGSLAPPNTYGEEDGVPKEKVDEVVVDEEVDAVPAVCVKLAVVFDSAEPVPNGNADAIVVLKGDVEEEEAAVEGNMLEK